MSRTTATSSRSEDDPLAIYSFDAQTFFHQTSNRDDRQST